MTLAFVCAVVGYVLGLLHGRSLTKPSQPRVSYYAAFKAYDQTHPLMRPIYGSPALNTGAVIINATQYNRGGPCS